MPYIDGLIKAEHSIHHVHSGGEERIGVRPTLSTFGTESGIGVAAEHSIHHVHSGGEVTAAVLAPWIGSITANDAAMDSLFPAPTPPESVAQDILDEAAAVHAEVLAAKAAAADDIAAVHADFAAAKKTEASALAQLEAEVAQSNAETLKSAQQALDDAKTDAQQDLAEARQEEKENLDLMAKDAKQAKEALEKKIKEFKSANQKAYDGRVKLAGQLTDDLNPAVWQVVERVTFGRPNRLGSKIRLACLRHP